MRVNLRPVHQEVGAGEVDNAVIPRVIGHLNDRGAVHHPGHRFHTAVINTAFIQSAPVDGAVLVIT